MTEGQTLLQKIFFSIFYVLVESFVLDCSISFKFPIFISLIINSLLGFSISLWSDRAESSVSSPVLLWPLYLSKADPSWVVNKSDIYKLIHNSSIIFPHYHSWGLKYSYNIWISFHQEIASFEEVLISFLSDILDLILE